MGSDCARYCRRYKDELVEFGLEEALRIRLRQREILHDVLYTWNLKRNEINELTYKTDLENECVVIKGEGWGKGIGSSGWTCTH